MNTLSIGTGRRDITPALGGQLFGYPGGTVSTGVDDALRATAVWMSGNGASALLVSIEVCLINTTLANRLRKAVSDATGVDEKHVVLSATHTHSGPNTAGMVGWGDYDAAYCETILLPRVVEAAKEAARAAQPATFGVGTIRSEAGINRREISPSGHVRLGQNPWGLFDPTMTVLSWAGLDGKPLVNCVHYGAHCTAAFRRPIVSRDWAGAMLDILERETGAPAMFLQGASGDVAPRVANGESVGGPEDYVREVGALAGLDAVRAFRSIKSRRGGSLRLATGELALPLQARIPLEAAQEKAARAEPGSRWADYYGRVVESYRQNQPEQTQCVVPQTLVALDDVVLVPFQFEVFSEIAMRLRAYSPFTHTLCLGTSNGSLGYLPTQCQLARGGYEVEVAKTESVWPWADDLDTRIIQENLKLMEALPCIG